MPTYDYKCTVCGVIFEMRQGFDAEPTQSCIECGKPSRRRFHAVGVIYKGTGFYTTDYKRKNAEVPSSSSEEGKSSEKPEATEATKTSDSTPDKDTSSQASTSATKDE